jgi:hypothetical protein
MNEYQTALEALAQKGKESQQLVAQYRAKAKELEVCWCGSVVVPV